MIDKSYTIQYSSEGVSQFASFLYVDDKLVEHTFHPKWSGAPSIEGLVSIKDILSVIEKSYQVEIILVDGSPIGYSSQGALDISQEDYKGFMQGLSFKFFESELLPILKENTWKVSHSWMHRAILIQRVIKGWDNVDSHHKSSMLIDCICNRFLNKVLGLNIYLDRYPYCPGDNFDLFMKHLDLGNLTDLNIFIPPQKLNR